MAQHKKDIRQAKEQTLKQVGELLCLSTVGKQTQYRDMPPELQGGLKYVSKTLQGVLGCNPDGSLRTQMDWKDECDTFAQAFAKLANLSREQIADVGLSCEDLVKAANTQLQSMPDIIDFVVEEPEQVA